MQVFRMIGPFELGQGGKSGSFHFQKRFHFRVKDKKTLSEISKRVQLRKSAKPMLKEKNQKHEQQTYLFILTEQFWTKTVKS